MYSARLVEVHFWLAISGTVIYVFAMWNSGIIQGLMWRTYNESGTLTYSFIESLVAMHPYYIARSLRRPAVPAGRGRRLLQCLDDDPAAQPEPPRSRPTDVPEPQAARPSRRSRDMAEFHRKLERNAIGFVLAIVVVASIGGFVEIAPLFTIDETVEDAPDMRVYTPLELAGRNIYIREGCYACH